MALVQKAEKPERDLVTATELDTINSQETVLDILDLIETLFGTAHLEQIVVIYKEITFVWIIDFAHAAQLVVEKGFPDCPDLGSTGQGIHQVGIIQEQLVG